MSANIPAHFAQQFATNIELLLQQKGTRLRMAVTEDSYVGEQASPVDQVGAINMRRVTSRFGQMGRVDAPLDRRWVSPEDDDLPQLIDTFDQLRLLTDPKSKYVENAVNAAGREFDRKILKAFFDPAKTGKTGTALTPFPASQQIAVNFGSAGNTGATVAKLREAKKILMAADVDLEQDQIFAALTAEQHDDLLAEAQVISTDFNDKPVLVEGKVTRFLGINFIHTQLVNVDGNGFRRMPVWAKSGMHLGLWNDIRTSISIRNDLSGEPWQAYVYMSSGATRIEEKKTVEIKCAE